MIQLAVLSESPADEEVARILVEAILGATTEPVKKLRLRTRGWPSVLNVLPQVVTASLYGGADSLVVVVDTDDSPIHESADKHTGGDATRCRTCLLRETLRDAAARLKIPPGRAPLDCAIGVATPAIEAWLMCGMASYNNEAEWGKKLMSGANLRDERLKLKGLAYGSRTPGASHQAQRAIELARRVSADLAALRRAFPHGFGAFESDIQRWRRDPR